MDIQILEGPSADVTDIQYFLINSDVIKALKSFPNECIDLIFADPPYELSNTEVEKITETVS